MHTLFKLLCRRIMKYTQSKLAKLLRKIIKNEYTVNCVEVNDMDFLKISKFCKPIPVTVKYLFVYIEIFIMIQFALEKRYDQ